MSFDANGEGLTPSGHAPSREKSRKKATPSSVPTHMPSGVGSRQLTRVEGTPSNASSGRHDPLLRRMLIAASRVANHVSPLASIATSATAFEASWPALLA